MRKYGISFYEFNPLGGGFLAGRYTEMNSEAEEGSRFDENKMQGKSESARSLLHGFTDIYAVYRARCTLLC